MKGLDDKDMTSFDSSKINLVKDYTTNVSGKKLFTIKELNDELKNTKEIYDNFMKTIEYAKECGIEVVEESIDEHILRGVYPAYMAISCAEATSNNSNLTGIPFGNRKEGSTPDEVMINTRTEGFSELIRRRFVIGSFILQRENQEKLFKNAQRIRRMIVDKMNELFEKYDGCLMPNTNTIAPHFGEAHDVMSDNYLLFAENLAIGNFGGYPSITIPSGLVDSMPVGVNITCPVKHDSDAINMAAALEEKIGFIPLNVREGK